MKKISNIILRIGITGLLLWLIFRGMDFQEILVVLKNIKPGIFFIVLLVYCVMSSLCAWRWYILLKDHKVEITYFRVLAYYFIGYFYNNFLPTVIGGGAVRAFYVGEFSGKRKEAVSSMLTEIGVGGWSLIAYSIIFYLLWFRVGVTKNIVFPLLGVFIFASASLYLFVERGFIRKFKWVVEKVQFLGFGDKLKKLYETIYFYRDKKLSLLKVVLSSFVLQFIIGIMNLLIGEALGYNIPFMSYIVYPALIGLITTLPITINGLGLREWGYGFFFRGVSLSMEQAVVLSLLFWFAGVVGSIIGGILFPFMNIRRAK